MDDPDDDDDTRDRATTDACEGTGANTCLRGDGDDDRDDDTRDERTANEFIHSPSDSFHRARVRVGSDGDRI